MAPDGAGERVERGVCGVMRETAYGVPPARGERLSGERLSNERLTEIRRLPRAGEEFANGRIYLDTNEEVD